jgi:hypothetical protein
MDTHLHVKKNGKQWELVATLDGYSQRRLFAYKREAVLAGEALGSLTDYTLKLLFTSPAPVSPDGYFSHRKLSVCVNEAKQVETVTCPVCGKEANGLILKTIIIKFGMCTDCRHK